MQRRTPPAAAALAGRSGSLFVDTGFAEDDDDADHDDHQGIAGGCGDRCLPARLMRSSPPWQSPRRALGLGFVLSGATVLALVMSAGYYRNFDSILVALSPSSGKSSRSAVGASSSGSRTSSSTPTLRNQGDRVHAEFRARDKRGRPSSPAPEGELSGEEKECTVWMAPSSVRGLNGYGLFTTRHLKAGESILGRPDGLAVPFEPYQHPDLPPRGDREKLLNLFAEYMWARGIPDHSSYEAPDRGFVMDYQIGFGSLPNHHCVLGYLDIVYPDPPYVDTLADRFRDPSAGAFSYNRGREFIVTRPVEAASEIFLNYGYCERPSSKVDDFQSPSWTEGMYVTQDFQDAADLIRRHIQEPAMSKLFHNVTGKLVAPLNATDEVVALLPRSDLELQRLYGRYYQAELVRQVALNSLDRKSVDAIRMTGTCLDNLVARRSTLPLAGQGAFAQRRIGEGQVIVPAPFLQAPNKESLQVYGRSGELNYTQLMLNYCWSHRESTLLLCPTTNIVLANHCSLRTKECGPKGPNAAYRWSSDLVTSRWRNMSWEELTNQAGRGLAMEIVALRDIAAGEEVFIDYGVEWEKAWAAHVAAWKPPAHPQSSASWIRARDANDNHGPIIDALVTNDIRNMSDHPYLFAGCVYWPTELDYDDVFQQPGFDWQGSMRDEELISTFSDPGSDYTYYDYARGYGHHSDRTHWPCTVVRPENDDGDTYLVRIHQAPWWRAESEDGASLPWHDNDLPRLLHEYPRSSIHYFVHPYTSDQHLPGAFRHELRIHDDLFPEQWRNLRDESR